MAISPPEDAAQVQELLAAEARRRAARRLEPMLGEEHAALAPAPAAAQAQQKPLSLAIAMRKCEGHNLATITVRGLEAAIRRSAAARMQPPRRSETTSEKTVVVTVENMPRRWLTSFMLAKGGRCPGTSAPTSSYTPLDITMSSVIMYSSRD